MDLSSKTVTLPSAITDTITNKLPLTGGTLTGALIGTNARFDNTATTPVRVHINNSGTNDYGLIYADTATAYKNVIINPNGGNVGIGTNSPGEKLEVNGSFKIGNLKIQNANGGRIGFNRNTANGDIYDSNFAAFQINGAYSGADFMAFEAYTSGGVGTDAMVIKDNGNVGIGTTNPEVKLEVNGGADGSVVFGGRSDGGNGNNRRFNLIAYADGGGSNYGGGLKIQTRDSVNVFHDRITVQSNGNVIIGDINTEGYKLEVVSDNAANNLMVHKKNAVGPGLATNIAMQVTQTNGQSARLAEIGADFVSGWGGSLHFSTKNDNGSPNNSTAERMRIDYDGRVTMPYQPSFCAGAGTSYTLVNFAQKINHSHEFSNIGGHYNNTNNRFTAPVAGTYFFWHRMNFGNAGTGNVEAKIYINGTERIRDYEYAGGTGQYNNSISIGTYFMNAGDYAEPWSHVNNTPQPTLVGSTTIQITTFGGYLIG
jgi:hypothetical protein